MDKYEYNKNNKDFLDIKNNIYLNEIEKEKEKEEFFSIKNLSFSKKLSQKYKSQLSNYYQNQNPNERKETENLNKINQNQNPFFLFNKREKNMLDSIESINKKLEEKNKAGKIINDFLFETQKLLGINNPMNLIENIVDVNNEKLIKNLQKLYKIVNHKANNR
jgi:hypothetical protein